MSKKDKPKKTEEPAADAAGAEGAEGAPAKKKMAGKTLILFIVLPAVLVLGGGGAAAMMLLGGGGAAAAPAAAAAGDHVVAEEGHAAAAAPAGEHGGLFLEVEGVVGVTFSLVPEHAAHGHGDEWGDVTVVEGDTARAGHTFTERVFGPGWWHGERVTGLLGDPAILGPLFNGRQGGGKLLLIGIE